MKKENKRIKDPDYILFLLFLFLLLKTSTVTRIINSPARCWLKVWEDRWERRFQRVYLWVKEWEVLPQLWCTLSLQLTKEHLLEQLRSPEKLFQRNKHNSSTLHCFIHNILIIVYNLGILLDYNALLHTTMIGLSVKMSVTLCLVVSLFMLQINQENNKKGEKPYHIGGCTSRAATE